MAKRKVPPWVSYLLTGMGGIVAGNLLTFFEVFRYFDTKPAHIVGQVDTPLSDLRVLLDGPEHIEIVDSNLGQFRFEGVLPGTHSMRFEHHAFGSFTYPVTITSPGEHVLPTKIALPRNRKENKGVGTIIQAAAVRHSEDGGDPLAKFAAHLPPTVLDSPGPIQVDEGWMYLGKKNMITQTQLVDIQHKTMIELVGAALLRERGPFEIKVGEGYMLGKPVGTTEPGQVVEVQAYKILEG